MDNVIIQNLYEKCEKDIVISRTEQEYFLKEDKISLREILNLIENETIKKLLRKYEEQQNCIGSEYNKRFFIEGFKEAIKLLKPK